MRDISHQPRSLRTAIAGATLLTGKQTIDRLKAGDLPQGDPLPVARIAAIQAAKTAGQLIPSCHSVPLDYVSVDFTLGEDRIEIKAEVKAIHRTGVEMQALTAVSVAALTLYDMLQALDPAAMSIEGVRVLSSKGDQKIPSGLSAKAGVLVLSDSVAAGIGRDGSGIVIRERLESFGVTIAAQQTIPDDAAQIEAVLKNWCDELKLDLIVTTGGTGVGPRDVTPETIAALIDRRLPGVEEAMRAHGQERVPTAMLSRSIAGQRGNTILVALPGSPKGVAESLDPILPGLLHAIPMMRGERHE